MCVCGGGEGSCKDSKASPMSVSLVAGYPIPRRGLGEIYSGKESAPQISVPRAWPDFLG